MRQHKHWLTQLSRKPTLNVLLSRLLRSAAVGLYIRLLDEPQHHNTPATTAITTLLLLCKWYFCEHNFAKLQRTTIQWISVSKNHRSRPFFNYFDSFTSIFSRNNTTHTQCPMQRTHSTSMFALNYYLAWRSNFQTFTFNNLTAIVYVFEFHFISLNITR